MTEPVKLLEYLEQFSIQWNERLGATGELLTRDIRQLVDLILIEHQEITEELIKIQVSPWALADNDEKIPLSKISKDGLIMLLTNPDYISNGELLEILRARLPGL